MGTQKIALDQAGFAQALELFTRKAGLPNILIIDLSAGPEVESLAGVPSVLRLPLRDPDIWALANGGSVIFFSPDSPEDFWQIDAPHGAENRVKVALNLAEVDAGLVEASKPPTGGPVQEDDPKDIKPGAEPQTADANANTSPPNPGDPATTQEPAGSHQGAAGPSPDGQSQG